METKQDRRLGWERGSFMQRDQRQPLQRGDTALGTERASYAGLPDGTGVCSEPGVAPGAADLYFAGSCWLPGWAEPGRPRPWGVAPWAVEGVVPPRVRLQAPVTGY